MKAKVDGLSIKIKDLPYIKYVPAELTSFEKVDASLQKFYNRKVVATSLTYHSKVA
jgi:hypothetical protein